ncbi:MAG: hypothetical protein AABY32_04355 [Nanoarchaeota archaeon]
MGWYKKATIPQEMDKRDKKDILSKIKNIIEPYLSVNGKESNKFIELKNKTLTDKGYLLVLKIGTYKIYNLPNSRSIQDNIDLNIYFNFRFSDKIDSNLWRIGASYTHSQKTISLQMNFSNEESPDINHLWDIMEEIEISLDHEFSHFINIIKRPGQEEKANEIIGREENMTQTQYARLPVEWDANISSIVHLYNRLKNKNQEPKTLKELVDISGPFFKPAIEKSRKWQILLSKRLAREGVVIRELGY